MTILDSNIIVRLASSNEKTKFRKSFAIEDDIP